MPSHSGAWVRGPLARIVQCAVGTHRLAHQHAIGGGFGTRPYRAVTGMIGETAGGCTCVQFPWKRGHLALSIR